MTHNVGVTTCSEPGCDKSFKNHRWGAIKQGEGWFVKRDGSGAWCPDHLPDWVPAWRARQKNRAKVTK